MLLSLKHVHAIQWVPLPTAETGLGGPTYQDYADEMSLDIYRRCLAAGKKVVLLSVKPFQVPTIYNAIGSDGIFIQSYCETRSEADELVAYAGKTWIKN
jgi:hypothetical protein